MHPDLNRRATADWEGTSGDTLSTADDHFHVRRHQDGPERGRGKLVVLCSEQACPETRLLAGDRYADSGRC